jgi:hypothetical protein
MSKVLVFLTAILPSIAFCYDYGQWNIINEEVFIPQESYSYTKICGPRDDDKIDCEFETSSYKLYFSVRQNGLGYVAVFMSYDNRDFAKVFESNVPLECGPSFCANPKLSSSLSWTKEPKSSKWGTTSYTFKYIQGKVVRGFNLDGIKRFPETAAVE